MSIAPRAKLDDGLLDLMAVPKFELQHLPALVNDLIHLKQQEPSFIRYEQLPWLEVESDHNIPISPDGEELNVKHVRIDVLKRRLKVLLPDSPLLSKS